MKDIFDFANKIIHGDCLESFKKIPDNSVDMTFADPPFNLRKNYSTYKDKMKIQEYLDWCEKWIAEMVRVTKPTGSIFVHNIPKWLTYYSAFLNKIAYFKHWISWDAPTAPMGKSLQPSNYGILFYGKEEKNTKIYELRYPHKRDRKQGCLLKDYGGKKDLLHPFGPLVSDVFTDIHRIKHNKKRDLHPCQLPIHLLDRLILLSTDENDIVLDPFSGTGTTAISAKRLGRKYIGLELDINYVEISQEKLDNITPNYRLGDRWVSFYLNDVVTIRDKDWEYVSDFFDVPQPIRSIDFTKCKLKSKDLLPSETGRNSQPCDKKNNISHPENSLFIEKIEKKKIAIQPEKYIHA
jgi:site-specific DNA-methyltransferase (adenine-specific)